MRITVDDAAIWATNKYIGYQYPQITETRRNQIFSITKYNLLATAFNASTVVLAVAVASAILFAYTAAVALGSIAIFVRLTTAKELSKYTMPLDRTVRPQLVGPPKEGATIWQHVDAFVPDLLRHHLGVMEPKEKEDNIFARLGANRPKDWVEDEHFVFDHAVWKNRVPVPEDPASKGAQPA